MRASGFLDIVEIYGKIEKNNERGGIMAQATEFPPSRILTMPQLMRTMRAGIDNGERFCFILGSGASVESGIPTGGTLEFRWMACMLGDRDDLDGTRKYSESETRELRQLAEHLQQEKKLDHTIEDMEKAYREAKEKSWKTLSSEYYFDLYTLRFYPQYQNGYAYMERLMEQAHPSFGYHALARLLSDADKGCNLVITTNFDSLVEKALAIYTDTLPLVINHEALSNYIKANTRRPIVAKVHRGLFFDPLNSPEETTQLKGDWKKILNQVFWSYTPVVIGYGGGDHSLMDYLETDVELPHGIYWAYRGEQPGERIQTLVNNKNGYLVKTAGFDSLMLFLGNEFYPKQTIPSAMETLLEQQTSDRVKEYAKQYEKLTRDAAESRETSAMAETVKDAAQQSRTRAVAEVRSKPEGERTDWDYFSLGMAEERAGHLDQAVDYYQRATELDPEEELYWYSLGDALAKCSQWKKAADAFSKTIELAGDSFDYFRRGLCFQKLEKHLKAVNDFTKALEISKANVGGLEMDVEDILRARAESYRAMGELQKAQADEEEAQRLEE